MHHVYELLNRRPLLYMFYITTVFNMPLFSYFFKPYKRRKP